MVRDNRGGTIVRTAVRVMTTGLIIVFAAMLAYGWWVTKPLFDAHLEASPFAQVAIAPADEALTLARGTDGRIFVVLASTVEGVTAIDVSSESADRFADVISAYNLLGAEKLLTLARQGEAQVLAWADLGVPVDAHFPHIAAGTNYRAHAEEVGLDGEPFLFPKLSDATAWNAPVRGAIRLDHEVELCAVPLSHATAAEPATLGYLLCGDYTDRWQLVSSIDLDRPMGLTGFPAGKGGSTRMPVGALFVIPGNANFYRSMDLKLYVNGQLRQQSLAGQMIWSPQEIIERALASCNADYEFGDATLKLTPCQHIPARTVLLTGTPEGVMFHLATLVNPFAYLREGDEVVSVSTHLGVLQNTVR